MEKFKERDLEANRIGNNATDEEWKIIKDFLCEGHILNQDSAKICYQNIKENKKWYYKLNAIVNDIVNDDNFMEIKIVIGFVAAVIAFGIYPGIIDDIVAPLIGYNYSLFYDIPDTLNGILRVATMAGAILAQAKVFNKLAYEKDIDLLQINLKKAIIQGKKASIKDRILNFFTKGTKEKNKISSQSLVDYVDKELSERGTNQDEEIIKRQNEKHASAFVKLIGNDMKSIIANPYPNCKEDLDALHSLANEYVENIVKEQEANLTSKITLKLSGSKDFYDRLNDLEAKIKRNMEINKIRKYNDGYLSDIIKDGAKVVEQSKQVYNGPTIDGHIPTIEEQFYHDLQVPTNDTGSTRKLKPNN